MKVKAVEVIPQDVQDMITTAFEGGSNYWLNHVELTNSTGKREKGLVWWGSLELFNPNLRLTLSYDNPDEGADTEKRTLSYDNLVKGFSVMAEKYPKHFADYIRDNWDADTADVWLQCVLFEEIIFG